MNLQQVLANDPFAQSLLGTIVALVGSGVLAKIFGKELLKANRKRHESHERVQNETAKELKDHALKIAVLDHRREEVEKDVDVAFKRLRALESDKAPLLRKAPVKITKKVKKTLRRQQKKKKKTK